MNKSELRTGMKVKIRNGEVFLIMRNVGTKLSNLVVGKSFHKLSDINDDLTCDFSKKYDIMKVYDSGSCCDSIKLTTAGGLLWERATEERHGDLIKIGDKKYSESTIIEALKEYVQD